VESTYEANFKERLPSNWFEFAKGCDFFEIPSPNAEVIALAQVSECFWALDISHFVNSSDS
jgi:hypothetical protein